jgi:hypothetical protein
VSAPDGGVTVLVVGERDLPDARLAGAAGVLRALDVLHEPVRPGLLAHHRVPELRHEYRLPSMESG